MSDKGKGKSGEDAREKLREVAAQRRAEREAEARRQELRDKVESRKAEREAETRRQELRDQVEARRAARESDAPPAPSAPASSRPPGVPGGRPGPSAAPQRPAAAPPRSRYAAASRWAARSSAARFDTAAWRTGRGSRRRARPFTADACPAPPPVHRRPRSCGGIVARGQTGN
jgi:translation initiation factor IF-2